MHYGLGEDTRWDIEDIIMNLGGSALPFIADSYDDTDTECEILLLRAPRRIGPDGQSMIETVFWRDEKLLSKLFWDYSLDKIGVDLDIMEEAYSLPEQFHQDPADRIIVASARLHSFQIITDDRKILDYPLGSLVSSLCPLNRLNTSLVVYTLS